MARTCSIERCENKHYGRGWCSKHWAQWNRHGDPLAPDHRFTNKQRCIVEGCKRQQYAKSYCRVHYRRWMKHGDPSVNMNESRGGIRPDGYKHFFRPNHPNCQKNGNILEHRLIMSEMLGRPLCPDETVHHKNGNRLDNRPENLQLFVSRHPAGQTPEDLVRFARDILARYEDIVSL